MQLLEAGRGQGRNDYPLRPMWNSLLAGCVFHKLTNQLWDQHQIKPLIAIRNCWQHGEADHDGVVIKLVTGQQNVIYTYDGEVSCVCPRSGEVHSMTCGGFERDRETLKYRCPAR